ncbi:MAG: twin-arginine translocase TatA/TatE family subunit [Candidatus Ratteibacteria bacterium]
MRILGIGFPEIVLILFVCVLLFGAKKLPELARSIGKSLGEFKKGIKEINDIEKEEEDED